MARPLRIEYPGAFYHIIQRGNERKDIFISPQDRTKFYDYLSILHTRYKVSIHTYCLMDNHYHLILETKQPNLSNAIHYLNASYTIYFRQISGLNPKFALETISQRKQLAQKCARLRQKFWDYPDILD